MDNINISALQDALKAAVAGKGRLPDAWKFGKPLTEQEFRERNLKAFSSVDLTNSSGSLSQDPSGGSSKQMLRVKLQEKIAGKQFQRASQNVKKIAIDKVASSSQQQLDTTTKEGPAEGINR